MFDKLFDRIIGHEAGYVNDPNDPGGETKWGISKRSYPNLIIKELTREQAKEIYKRDFYDKIWIDTMTDGMLFQVFDFAVNSSVETAIRYLQRAVGAADDGIIGPITKEALAKIGESDFIMYYNAERLHYMTKLNNWPHHGKGWARRIANNLRYGAQDS